MNFSNKRPFLKKEKLYNYWPERKFEPKVRKVSCFLYSYSSYKNQQVDMLSTENKKCYKHFNSRGVINHGNILEYILYLNDIIEDLYRLRM